MKRRWSVNSEPCAAANRNQAIEKAYTGECEWTTTSRFGTKSPDVFDPTLVFDDSASFTKVARSSVASGSGLIPWHLNPRWYPGGMSSFSESALEKKLSDLSSSQQSVQTLSLWIIHHRKHSGLIVKVWHRELKKGKQTCPWFSVSNKWCWKSCRLWRTQ